MKAPLSWLKEYVDIDISAQELMRKLFSCGFEVEELIEIGKDISNVVVGEVLECEGVEGTHLHVCKVDCGAHGVLQICCGADNVEKGIKAPVALVGATVYATGKDHKTVEGVATIKKGKLRGIDSEGMLCSGVEIGVNGDFFEGGDYNGLLILPQDFKNGEDIKPLLGLDDYVFDVAITANRPDCQSVYGLAREVAALLDKPLKPLDLSYTPTHCQKTVKITDAAPELCPRYIGHYVKDIKIAPSPAWLKKRISLCGLNSKNNVVDITNYVLLELGQPMHSFDFDKLEGGEIVIRRANEGEKIVTLDGNEFALKGDNLVICDKVKPCALAGVMGGLNSGICETTVNVLFEAAKFARDNVRKTARALGQHSDSSALFEKGVSEYTVEVAADRALHLIEELGCGTVTDVRTDVTTPYSDRKNKRLCASVKRINDLLGIDVPASAMVKILKNLDFGVDNEGDELKIVVPRWREDIDQYPDVAEEVIRFYGYDNVKGTFLPSATITNGGYSKEQKEEIALKRFLSACGLSEITTYSFYSPKDFDILHIGADSPLRRAIKILNPISEELSIMRTTLAPSILQVAVKNLKKGNLEGKVYELGKVYEAESLPLCDFPKERKTLALGAWGKCDFFDVKGITEELAEALHVKFEYEPERREFLHPGICAAIKANGEKIGYIGKLSPEIAAELALERDVFLGEIDYEKLCENKKPFKYSPLPKFAVEKRDLALVCDKGVTCAEIERIILGACKYVTGAELFDVYEGEQLGADKKSMAFTVTFTPKDEDISDRIDGFVKKILGNLKYNLGVELR